MSLDYRIEQVNGDNVDCPYCDNSIMSIMQLYVNTADGYAWHPECLVQYWRDENSDDDQNHTYVGSDSGTAPCLICGDDAGGLLHAFDPNLGDGYHDEPILEIAIDTVTLDENMEA